MARVTYIDFFCPDCSGQLLTEVMHGTTVKNELLAIGEVESGPFFEWGETDFEDGHIAWFECSDCSSVVRDKDGNPIRNYEDLIKWLKEEQERRREI